MKFSVIEEYWKHTALNLGQAVRDLRYFYCHPDADKYATEGSSKHVFYSFGRRVRSFGTNLFYSVIPPHWHHTKEDLQYISPASAIELFLHGYAPWNYEDPIKKSEK